MPKQACGNCSMPVSYDKEEKDWRCRNCGWDAAKEQTRSLFFAAEEGDASTVALLLDAGADINARDRNDRRL